MIVFVKSAGYLHAGLARISLAVHGEAKSEPRTLAASAYAVAARLEQIAEADGLNYSVSASKARLGIVEFNYFIGTEEVGGIGMDDEIATEIAIEACADCGFLPADALVEMGEIDPTAEG